MRSRLPSADARRAARQRGFTLIELMVGLAIGLLATLAVTQVLVNFEAQKRTTSSGSDAQVNGALALDMLSRMLQSAGYGMGANSTALGCALAASYGGTSATATVSAFPTVLAPVVITDGASGAPDTIAVLSSGKRSFSLPLRISTGGATPNTNPTSFPVASALGVEGPVNDTGGTQISSGDLLVASNGGANCDLFQATAVAGTTITRGNGSNWNPAAALTNNYVDGNYLINLGMPTHRIFTIANDSLRQNTFQMSSAGVPSYSGATEVFSGIVSIQAQYGHDADANGSVETWNTTTPTTNAGWRALLAVRIVVVARSGQYEKEMVTRVCPTWDGASIAIPGAPTGCPADATNTDDEEWKHYRYKVFDTVVPLRNLLWSS